MTGFERVKDPMRLRTGDVLCLPAVPKLDLKVATLAKCGLSVGMTSRADNSGMTVKNWLTGRDRPQLFLVAETMVDEQSRDTSSLLALDTDVRMEEEDPVVLRGKMVPFGPRPDRCWSRGQWTGCWNRVHDDAVMKALGKRVGVAGLLVYGSLGEDVRDRYATQVWNGDQRLAETPLRDGGMDSETRDVFPVCRSDDAAPDHEYEEFYKAQLAWSTFARGDRVDFGSVFLQVMVNRGAYALRPTEWLVRQTTDECVSWWSAEMGRRFAARAEVSRLFLEGLRKDRMRDMGRRALYARAARQTAGAGARVRAAEAAAVAKGGA